jgi:alanine racemase
MNKFNYRTWIEIDKKAIADNMSIMKGKLEKNVSFMAIVKANGYGCGIKEVSKIAVKEKASFLGVSYVEEVISLRKSGFKVPILMLTQPFDFDLLNVIDYDICPTIYSLDIAIKLSRLAKRMNKTVKIHIKIETGLNRLGIKPEDVLGFISKISELPNILIDGIYTHFADAYENNLALSKKQLEIFENIVRQIPFKIHYLHAANSAAVAWFPKSQFNLVRFGLAAYGLEPSTKKKYKPGLKNVFTWKTRVLAVKDIKKNANVGYGNNWHAPKDMKIAVIAIGYADGFRRTPINFEFVLCKGKKVPIIGSVMMQQSIIDITTIKGEVFFEEEIVIIGKQGDKIITPEDIANNCGTINEEILTSTSSNIPRVFIN